MSKALFISIVTRRGFWLKPSSMYWVKFVRRVEVEWFFLNCVGKGREECRPLNVGEGE